jgi:hypothetical protein
VQSDGVGLLLRLAVGVLRSFNREVADTPLLVPQVRRVD